jgi:hypothetical protein
MPYTAFLGVDAISYYDSSHFIINPIQTKFLFGIDTSLKLYSTVTYDQALEIFNNLNDTVTIDSCLLAMASNSNIEMRTLKNSTAFTTIKIDSFSTSLYSLRFSLSTPLFNKDTQLVGSIKVHAHNSHFDTAFTYSITLDFPGLKSGVTQHTSDDQYINIFPNPSQGLLSVVCSLQKSSFLHLLIFDELGKDIMTVYDGMLPEGRRDFSFKLPQGVYYVRMETAEEVVTKKVVVE